MSSQGPLAFDNHNTYESSHTFSGSPKIKFVFGGIKQNPSASNSPPESMSDGDYSNSPRKHTISSPIMVHDEPQNPSTPGSMDEEFHLSGSPTRLSNADDDSVSLHDLLPTPNRSVKSRKQQPVRSVSPKKDEHERISHQIIKLQFVQGTSTNDDGDNDQTQYMQRLVSYYRTKRETSIRKNKRRHERYLATKHTDPLPRTARRLADLKRLL